MSIRVRLACLAALLPPTLPAQAERYEVGLRVKDMERAFESKRADGAAHRRALPSLQRAVASFFTMRLGDAGRALDQARHELLGETTSEAVQWADSLVFRPERRLVDAGAKTLSVRVAALYRVDAEVPAGVRIEVRENRPAGPVVLGSVALAELPVEFPIARPAIGDSSVQFVVTGGGATLREVTQVLSVVPDLDRRLRSLVDGEAAPGAERATIDAATLRGHLATLQALRGGKPLESDVRAGRLLEEAEALQQNLAAGKPFFAGRTSDERTPFALRVPLGKTTMHVAVHVPPATGRAGRKVPLVVALHGAGGSENLFIEGYGDGLVVRLCRESGWMLAAPRNASAGAVQELVGELAALWPVDRERVFLLGHSMGAMTAVAAACAAPRRYRAVAALGGGGAVREVEGLTSLPFFVAAGSADFGKGSAQVLARALRNAEVEDVRWREYPGIEHLVIVQAALPDVFRFFAECSSGPASAPASRAAGR